MRTQLRLSQGYRSGAAGLRYAGACSGHTTAAALAARGGVTLFELVTVLTIMAVMAGITVPRVNNMMRRHRLEVAARLVTEGLSLARAEAIRDKADRKVVFEPTSQRYRIPEVRPATAADAEYTVDFRITTPRVALWSADFASASEVTFNRLGIPAASGTVTLCDGVDQVQIVVSASTGRVTRSYAAATEEMLSGYATAMVSAEGGSETAGEVADSGSVEAKGLTETSSSSTSSGKTTSTKSNSSNSSNK